MTYKIVFMSGERVIGTSLWDGTLDSAKQRAKDYMPIQKANRVEVRNDDDNTLLFQYPRTLNA
jgi:hypothetical protein